MNFYSSMRTVIQRGIDSPVKKAMLLKQLKRDAKNPEWENTLRSVSDGGTMFQLACANLMNGNYDWEGWGYRNPREGIIPTYAPWWDGQPVDNLIVLGEMGLGDEILFASVFGDIKSKNITIECDERLVSIFSRSFPHITFHGRDHYTVGQWGSHKVKGDFDAQILMGDLPTFYRRKKSDFPGKAYLKPLSTAKTGLVGVSWKGRQGEIDIPLTDNMISLQYGVDDHKGLKVPDFDLKNDLEALFSLVSGLDKVICVPTSVLHIAGALGVEVEVVIPKKGTGWEGVGETLDWRFPCVWHESVKL